MTGKLVQNGKRITWTNGGSAVLSGAIVIVANLICIALGDIGAGETGELGIGEVYTAPKVSGAVIGQGETVYWDVSAGAFDDNAATPASGDIKNGAVAWKAAGNGVTTVDVVLLQSGGVVH